MQSSRKDTKTFEETFPHYPFAELVRLALLLGKRLARARLRDGERRRGLATRQRTNESYLNLR